VSRRVEWALVATLLCALVLLRAWPFVAWPAAHFDSDQAIVGLMAKHISEGRAFPLYYYGQQYMLAVEAWLAAPVMLAFGPTVTSLKIPLVAINLATVLLLLRISVREVGLRPALAAIAVLPVALPAAGVAARVVEANGGNVGPWLYVLLLWITRDRPWLCGAILGLGSLQREFTLYGAAALIVVDLGRLVLVRPRALGTFGPVLERWTMVAIAAIGVRGTAASLQPFASALGPGTTGGDPMLRAWVADPVVGRLCFDPSLWPARAAALVTDHLPRLVGGMPAPLQDYGVLTGVFSGTTGLGLWVGALMGVCLAGGVWQAWAGSAARQSTSDEAQSQGTGWAAFPIYLLLIGVISTVVYGFATCSAVHVATLRYNLLTVFVPVAALLVGLRAFTSAPARAGIAAAVVLWCALNLSDILALADEYRRHPPLDQRQAVVDALNQNGVETAWSAHRNAYHLTFISQERVRVSANDFIRIKEYWEEARRTRAPTISERPCEGGAELVPGLLLCP
jgi:hypothetical protein